MTAIYAPSLTYISSNDMKCNWKYDMLLRMKQMPHQFSYIISMVVMLSLDLIFSFFLINRKRTDYSIFHVTCTFQIAIIFYTSLFIIHGISAAWLEFFLFQKKFAKIRTFQIKQIKTALLEFPGWPELHLQYHQFSY